MPDTDLPLILPTVPEGFCNTLAGSDDWIQQIFNLLATGVARLTVAVGKPVVSSASSPDPTQRNLVLWRPTNPGNGGRIYEYQGGAWVSEHPTAPNDANGPGRRIWWEGTEAALWFEDGGDGTNPSTYAPASAATNAGPMWVVDHNYDGRSPMGAGDIPSTTPVKTLAVSENYGEGQHTLTALENGPHSHGTQNAGDSFATLKAGSGASQDNTALRTVNDGVTGTNGWLGAYPNTGVSGGDATTHDPVGHQNVHPVRGGFWARRSARVNYIAQ